MTRTIEGNLASAVGLLREAVICWEDAESHTRRGTSSKMVARYAERANIRQLFAHAHLRDALRGLQEEPDAHDVFYTLLSTLVEDVGDFDDKDELDSAQTELQDAIKLLSDLDCEPYSSDPAAKSTCQMVLATINAVQENLKALHLTDRDQ